MNIKLLLRRGIVRILTPMSWRASDERLAKSLNRFSQVEADSSWQMLQALDANTDREFKAELFNNALEEVHHAALFGKLAREFSNVPPSLSAPHRQQLFDPEAGMLEFEAFHFVGETEVYDQFYAYAKAAHRPTVREMFLQIRGDEEEHQKLAYRELVKLSGSEKAAGKLIRRVRRRRLYEAWMRFSTALGDKMSGVLLSVLFFLAAPLFTPMCRKRINDLGWKDRLGAAGAESNVAPFGQRERPAA